MLASTLPRRAALSFSTFRSASTWSAVAAGPPDPILGAYIFLLLGPYIFPLLSLIWFLL